MRKVLDRDRTRLNDILQSIRYIEQILAHAQYDDFAHKPEIHFSLLKLLEIIGEACSRMSKSFRKRNDHIPWNNIIAFRNFAVHEYFRVNSDFTWRILQEEIPLLKTQITHLLPPSQHPKPIF
jgi:uncharacterized protein with HEPN domain